MGAVENLEMGDSLLYADGYFSGDYNQEMHLKRSNDDGSNKAKFYIFCHSNINNEVVKQGYLYFYLDKETKTSKFIGLKVEEAYRNLNIGSLLVANWIDFCLNSGYDFLGVNKKQRKPFLMYLLKTYGFEVLDKSLYEKRSDVISICRDVDFANREKLLLFKDEKHEKQFREQKIHQSDNYKIIHDPKNTILLDKIILPFQNIKRSPIDYMLLDQEAAQKKTDTVISRHKR